MKRLFTAPLQIASTFKMLSALNDSKPEDIHNQAFLYEWTYQLSDSSMLEIVAHSNRAVVTKRICTFNQVAEQQNSYCKWNG